MIKWLQRLLLVLGVLSLMIVLVNIVISIAATTPGTTPARIVHTRAGPYQLQVSLYKYPANAGYALPLKIEVLPATQDTLHFMVSSLPGKDIDATPINGTLSANGPSSVQGVIEITVQGTWTLHIVVEGSAGKGAADIPIEATVPPILPGWSGWLLGIAPLVGLLIFLLIQAQKQKASSPVEEKPSVALDIDEISVEV